MSDTKRRTRLICCVDGTYCTPDGPSGRGHGNISNIYRIFASIKEGVCYDKVNEQPVVQKKLYEEGVGCEEPSSFEKLKAGVFGKGFKKIIRTVYESCSQLHAEDEVWLYGFSRGAYIVRAVAGLLHHIWALQSAGTSNFESDYNKALKVYLSPERRETVGQGQYHNFVSCKLKTAPQIKFVGVFDTVKALKDEDLFDITFNDSIQHLRHAVALNEDRRDMEPELIFPNYNETKTRLSKRSIIQAWFVGAHIDMGGSEEQDGLALYPLQWMLFESRLKGLVLEFSRVTHRRAQIDDPLEVAFPTRATEIDAWTCTTKNGVEICMQDLRKVHETEVYKGRYGIKINKRKEFYWRRKSREPFTSTGDLKGYCTFAPQGTIVHPSVYQYLDEYLVTAGGLLKSQDRETLEKWRAKMLGKAHSVTNQGFWADRETSEIDELKYIRILVCGNTGVGKSTLVNRVFGVSTANEVTKSSDRQRGLHDVGQEIKHEQRPDLIIHDSGGFEAGDEAQILAVQQFVKDRSSRIRVEDRLHIIWFCVEMNSARTQQTATESLFKAVSEYAAEVPIIVVATKMDEFRGIKREEAREMYEEETPDMLELDQKCKAYMTEKVRERMELIEQEMQQTEGGRFDACVDVARNDKNSIKRLNDVSLQNVKHEKLRLLYVAAQIADIDHKINYAILETMKIYKRVLASTTALGAVPTSALTNRTASAVAVCRAVVQCFGIPTVSYQTVFQILKSTVLDDLIHNMSVLLGEAIAAVGMVATVGTFGAPFFLASGFVNIPLVVPATMRLILMLATDLILILVRAFKETTFYCIGQPLLKDVQSAAINYAPMSNRVHKAILDLVPKRNVMKSFKYHKVQLGLEKAVHSFKVEVTKEAEKAQSSRHLSVTSTTSTTSLSSDRTLVKSEIDEIVHVLKGAQVEIQEIQHTTSEADQYSITDEKATNVTTAKRGNRQESAEALDEGFKRFRV